MALWWFNGIFHGIYPLVNVYRKLWKDPPCLMGKLTISMAIFDSYVKLPEGTKYTRGVKRTLFLKKVELADSDSWGKREHDFLVSLPIIGG